MTLSWKIAVPATCVAVICGAAILWTVHKKKAIERGMITLRRSGLIKVAAGITTLEEVARETIH